MVAVFDMVLLPEDCPVSLFLGIFSGTYPIFEYVDAQDPSFLLHTVHLHESGSVTLPLPVWLAVVRVGNNLFDEYELNAHDTRVVFTEALPVAAVCINGKGTGGGEGFSETSAYTVVLFLENLPRAALVQNWRKAAKVCILGR